MKFSKKYFFAALLLFALFSKEVLACACGCGADVG
jgi:hypothetical protein